MEYIILIAGISSLLIGIISLINGKRTGKTTMFFLFCFVTSVWIIFNFLAYHFNDVRYLYPVYGLAILVLTVLLCWTYAYADEKNSSRKQLIIFIVGLFLAIVVGCTRLFIESIQSMNGSAVILEKGPLFPLFGLYMIITVGLSLYKILSVYRSSKGNSKKQAGLVLIGLLGCATNSLVVGVLLPMAGIYSFVNLDSPSFIIFIVLACIAILKYQFLDIKVIMAELMVVLLITLSIVDMMYYQSQTELIVKIFFGFILVAMGIFLVKSVHSEVLRKEELEIANAKLMELDKSKSEFISIASHQLRTPLTSMKGFISIMKNGSYGKLPRKLEEPIGHIETANERLISLVKNMLDISRIEAGGMAFEFKKEDLGALADELHQSFLPIAKEKNVSMELEIQKGLPKIKIDYVKVRELISNIIDNAIKYTEKGNIKIALKKKKDSVQVAVSDTGIGISEKELKGLFDKFFRGKKARQLKKNGSGLGLYLGRKIVEAHGGKIYARSKGSSKGSTFFVELPIG